MASLSQPWMINQWKLARHRQEPNLAVPTGILLQIKRQVIDTGNQTEIMLVYGAETRHDEEHDGVSNFVE